MDIEQFVMAYEIEQDRVRAMLPEGYESLRPVLGLILRSEVKSVPT